MSRLAVACVAALALAAGCAAPAASPPATTLPSVTAPSVDAAALLEELRAFAQDHPSRHPGSPTHAAARDWVRAQIEEAGLDVFEDPFGDGFASVCGVLPGRAQEGFVLVASHFDNAETAVQGAYDDGSGTLMTIGLARAFSAAQIPLARTVVFCAWDGEDQGLLGSAHMAETILAGAFPVAGEPIAVIDLDMVGIAYPARTPLVADVTTEPLREILATAAREAAHYPDDAIEFRPLDSGFNGARHFVAAGYPTAFLISAADRVRDDGPQAGNPFWHALDTYDAMVVVAGDEATLRAGFQGVLDLVSAAIVRLATSESSS